MIVTSGKSILERIVRGRLQFLHRAFSEIAEVSQLPWEEEAARFRDAQRQAMFQLGATYKQASQQVGEKLASIFAAHAMLLEDKDFEGAVLSIIRERNATAEYAVRMAGKALASAFHSMPDTYMKARAADFRDISRRVVLQLQEKSWRNPLWEGPAILVTDELLPSEIMKLMDLEHQNLLGLIARKGSVDSHAAILLKAYGIPGMAEVDLDEEWDGHMALLDGYGQRLYVDPDPALERELWARYQADGILAGV